MNSSLIIGFFSKQEILQRYVRCLKEYRYNFFLTQSHLWANDISNMLAKYEWDPFQRFLLKLPEDTEALLTVLTMINEQLNPTHGHTKIFLTTEDTLNLFSLLYFSNCFCIMLWFSKLLNSKEDYFCNKLGIFAGMKSFNEK